MPLVPGFTRFRGQVINALEAGELRKLARRLRQQLQAHRLNNADETFQELLDMSRCGCDPVGMRQAINELYEQEWKQAELPRRWKPAELREATLRLLNEEGVQSGYWGACSIDSEWLVDQGFPDEFVLPMIEDFHYEPDKPQTAIIRHSEDGTAYLVNHVRAVSFLSMLRALAKVFGVDTREADRDLGRKSSARRLSEGIKKAIAEQERMIQ